MAGIRIAEGSWVKVKADGSLGKVSALFPVKTGGRGRPRTNVIVTTKDGVTECGLGDLLVASEKDLKLV